MLQKLIRIVEDAGEMIRCAHHIEEDITEKSSPIDVVTKYDTAVQEHLYGVLKRKNCITEEYNRVAVETLKPLGVGINDLYALTKDFPESYFSDATHFNTKEGQSRLVKQVVFCIEQELGITARELDFDQFFAKETNIVGI